MLNHSLVVHINLLLSSYHRLTGQLLLHSYGLSPEVMAQRADEAPFALVSHGTEADPIFNYGNKTALCLFARSWEEFTTLPSRFSAEEMIREERDKLLREVKTKGFVSGYSGIRIAKDGRRFLAEDIKVWNVLDDTGHYHGQAATYSEWRYL